MTTVSGNNNFIINAANNYFNGLQIQMPPIPPELVEKIHIFQPDLFGSRIESSPVNDILTFVKESLSKPIEPYVLFGHAGHGFKSKALHYYCVTNNVALFYQLYIGLEEGEEDSVSRIDSTFYGIELLLNSIEESRKKGLLPQDQKLYVVESDFYVHGWGWVKGYPGEIDSAIWNSAEPITLSASYSIPS